MGRGERRAHGHIFEIKSTYILQPGPASLTEGSLSCTRTSARGAEL